MLKLTGRLNSKSLIKSGTNEFGTWQIIEFTIKKSYRRKKTLIAFKAFGKRADIINSIEIKEKIVVEFLPECKYSEKHGRYFTELKTIDVYKYVPRNNQDIYVNQERLNESDYELNINNEIKFPPH